MEAKYLGIFRIFLYRKILKIPKYFASTMRIYFFFCHILGTGPQSQNTLQIQYIWQENRFLCFISVPHFWVPGYGLRFGYKIPLLISLTPMLKWLSGVTPVSEGKICFGTGMCSGPRGCPRNWKWTTRTRWTPQKLHIGAVPAPGCVP